MDLNAIKNRLDQMNKQTTSNSGGTNYIDSTMWVES